MDQVIIPENRQGMRILLTGSSGFLGGYLKSAWKDVHDVKTIGRSSSNDIICDLSRRTPELTEVDMVIHAAGKAHVVPRTAEEAQAFMDVNVTGTENLLKGLDELQKKPDTLVFISTVAVYGLDSGINIEENHPTLGGTPYGDSKIRAEDILLHWGRQHGVGIVILRIPLIAGEGAPGNLGAMIRAMKRGYYFRIGDGKGRKSMVNASDLAQFLPTLHGREGVYNLTDGHHPSLSELDTLLAAQLGKRVRSIPEDIASVLARVGDRLTVLPFNSYRLDKLRRNLTFSDEKARRELGWNPVRVLDALKA